MLPAIIFGALIVFGLRNRRPMGADAETRTRSQLTKLLELHRSGALSDAEFASAARKLLDVAPDA